MFLRISKIVAIIIFLVSVIQLYRDPNIGYLIVALSSFASLMTWLKGPVILAAETLNNPNMDAVNHGIQRLEEINSWSSKLELSWVMRFHQNPVVSKKATIALANCADPRALKGMVKYLPDTDALVALTHLKVIKDKQVIKILLSSINNTIDMIEAQSFLFTSEKETPLSAVVNCLGKTNEEAAVKPLIILFGHLIDTGLHKTYREIINSLGNIGNLDAKNFLVELYKREWICPRQKRTSIFHDCNSKYYAQSTIVKNALINIMTQKGFDEFDSKVIVQQNSFSPSPPSDSPSDS